MRAQIRTQHVLDLLGSDVWSGFELQHLQLPLAVLGRLIEVCGAFTIPPPDHDRGHDDRSESMLALLHRIAALATIDARDELVRLAALPRFAQATNTMAWLIKQQGNLLFDATFKHAELPAVLDIIGGQAPQRIHDMFERVSDLMDELAVHLRTDSSNSLCAY